MARRRTSNADSIKAGCLACEEQRTLDHFRVFSDNPLTYFDFCMSCEKAHGTVLLYTRYLPQIEDRRVFDAVAYAHSLKPENRSIEQRRMIVPAPRALPTVSVEPKIDESLKQEMAQRELCRRHLIPFVKRFEPDYAAGWMHHDIASRLEKFVRDIENGKSPRLMICMPPRAGKSTLASKYLPSWALGKHPEWEIISTSYAVSLPLEFSALIRDTLRSTKYSNVFPETQLRGDRTALEEWSTTKRGGYKAAGVGGGITGKGAHLAIVDDPFKDRQEAQSETIRKTVHGWYATVLNTRLAPGGGVLIINTRWHDDDLSGHLLEMEREALEAGADPATVDHWDIVSYPAIAEHDEYLFRDGTIQHDPVDPPATARLLRRTGEALHPERYPLNDLLKKKATMTSADWNAMFQQNPVPDDGEFFKRHEIELMPRLTREQLQECNVFLAIDLALGDKRVNDWTVLAVMVQDADDRLQVAHTIRGRFKSIALVKLIVDTAREWNPDRIGLEKSHQSDALMPYIKAALHKAGLTVAFDDELVPIKDKTTRATILQGRAQMGTFGVTAFAPWVDQAINEMLRFPNGKHDDVVDAYTWGCHMAQRMGKPRRRGVKSVTKASWRKKLRHPTTQKHPMAG